MAPRTSTNTCCQVGSVKPCWNGSIQAASLFGTKRVTCRSESVVGARLTVKELRANRLRDHNRFNGDHKRFNIA